MRKLACPVCRQPDAPSVVLGLSAAKKGARYALSKDGAELYPVQVLYVEKGVSLPGLLHESVTFSDAAVALTTGNPAVALPLADEDVILRDAGIVPLAVEKLRSSVQNGKVYEMWGGVSTGARLVVGGEEYAVVDYCSAPARVLVNRAFSQPLTEAQRDYLASVVLGLYAYYKLLEQAGDTAGQTLSIVN